MPKDIMINEGREIKVIKDVEKLTTLNPDDTEANWIPEDETRLTVKTIIVDGTYVAANDVGKPYGYSEVTVSGVGSKVVGQTAVKEFTENGTYYADQDEDGPFYGYSKVIVNVKDSSSGSSHKTSGTVGKDEDGDTAMVLVNPETEELVVEKLPVSIAIVTPPAYTGPYGDGAIIGFDGLVVQAYDADGNVWNSLNYPDGIIPFDELLLPATVTDIAKVDTEESTSSIEDRSALISSDSPSSVPYVETDTITFTNPEAYYKWNRIQVINPIFPVYAVVIDDSASDYYHVMMYSKNSFSLNVYNSTSLTGEPIAYQYTHGVSLEVYSGERNVYYHDYYLNTEFSYGSVPVTTLNTWDHSGIPKDVGFVILYGVHSGGSTQTVPVQWPRPGDGELLETTFSVSVVDVAPKEE